jgi:hypothetical protein
MREHMTEVIEEALQHALEKYGVDIKINNLDNVLDKLDSLVQKLIFEKNLDIIWFVKAEFQIRTSPTEGYFIDFIFEPYEDVYNYGRISDVRFNNLVLVVISLSSNPGIDEDEYELQFKKVESILKQLQVNVEKNFDNLEPEDSKHFNFELPLDVEIFRYLV